jgi:nitrate/nitrite-specific signal transduction histidine kinase
MRELLLATAVMTVVLVFLVGAVAMALVTKMLLKPIRQITAKAKALAARDYRSSLGWKRRDEVGLLASEMDALCEQLEAEHFRRAD